MKDSLNPSRFDLRMAAATAHFGETVEERVAAIELLFSTCISRMDAVDKLTEELALRSKPVQPSAQVPLSNLALLSAAVAADIRADEERDRPSLGELRAAVGNLDWSGK